MAREQSLGAPGPSKQLEEAQVKQLVAGMLQQHAARFQSSIDHVHSWCQKRFAKVEQLVQEIPASKPIASGQPDEHGNIS